MNANLIDSLCYKGSLMNDTLRTRAAITAAICRILVNEDKPITVREITSRLQDEKLTVSYYSPWNNAERVLTLPDFEKNSHVITHAMRRLVQTGAVKAEKKDFGEVTLNNGKTIHDIRNVYSLVR